MYLGEVEIGYEEVASFLQVSPRITMKSKRKFTKKSAFHSSLDFCFRLE